MAEILEFAAVHGVLQARILERVAISFSGEGWGGVGGLPDPGIEPPSLVSPALQANSLHADPLGKTFSCGMWDLVP